MAMLFNYIIEKLQLRALYFGVQNLWRWLPIIWQDRQWDQSYLFWILQLKLSLMEKYFDSDKSVSTDHKRQAAKIRICRLLVDRIQLNDYTTPFDVRDEPRSKLWSNTFDNSMSLSTDNIVRRDDSPLETKIFNWKIEHEELLEKQDLELLFKLMNKHICGWWD